MATCIYACDQIRRNKFLDIVGSVWITTSLVSTRPATASAGSAL